MTLNVSLSPLPKKNDVAFFESLMDAYEQPLYVYLLHLVRNRQDAEDLIQETFLKVYRHLGTIDPGQNIKSWLYTIATRTAYDWLRKKGAHKEVFAIDDAADPFETIDAYDPYYLVGEARDIEEALGKLRPVYRTVLMLYYYQEFRYEEIAATLSLPLNTVKTYLLRAKQALKAELEK